ncbi:hypothetical protein Psch_02151 [Pelotomaculum schinkii]|uniref:DUF1294 domain-containing protein n=1 Tax=Pelotomaculum schinkii TaxID=78350 RepID=A0A4Y7RIE4_9FIRM|nr:MULTISPECIES: DUF1294 domain-containing protein [Pelotomaculum]TEB08586.1 hypothetical protein Psch_02151 [Pelotomaculum schinkii]TEB17122.1 hypothetical protein Psfp_00857 [Pelotomaculum sp. FP]
MIIIDAGIVQAIYIYCGGISLLYSILLINVIGFCTMWYDKKMAQAGKYRVPESRIFLIAIVGGAVGVLLGMEIFRHKTKDLKFKVLIPVIIILQVILYRIFYMK